MQTGPRCLRGGAARWLGPAPGGRGDPAERWYRKAADGGDADAMFNLGALLAEQGEEDQAEQWYRKAVDTGRRDG